MANNYRPKSLDELNNLYDKAISAQQAIQKGSSLLGAEDDDKKSVPNETYSTQVRSKPANENEISGAVEDFIKRFSSEAKNNPEPTPKNASPAPLVNPFEDDEKPLSGLMNDYVKIMNGEDEDEDEDESRGSIGRLFKSRRGEKAGRKKTSKTISDDFESSSEPDFEADNRQADELTDDNNEVQTKIELPDLEIPAYEPSYEKPRKSTGEYIDSFTFDEGVSFDRSNEAEESFSFGQVSAPQKSSAGQIAAKAVLTVLLIVTLLSTLAVGLLNTVFSVNTGEKTPGDYVLFVAKYDCEVADIKSNDFVICKAENMVKNESIVVFTDDERSSFTFGKTNGGKTDDEGKIVYNISDVQVPRANVLGVVSKVIPEVGSFIKTITDNFLIIILLLVALAIGLTLLLCLGFKGKNKPQKKRSKIEEANGPLPFDDDDFESTESNDSNSDEENKASDATNTFDSLD